MSQSHITRPIAIITAAAILGFAVVSLRRAYAMAAVPSFVRYVLTIPANGHSAPIPFGNKDTPISINVSQITLGYRSTSFVNATYATLGGAPCVSWVGINEQSTGTISNNYTTNGGVKMLTTGYGGSSEMDTVTDASGYPSAFQIKNTSPAILTVVVSQSF